MICLKQTAYGKLNLTLDILGRREDGYHDLQMVMTTVSVCDEVKLALQTGQPWQVTCDWAEIPQGAGNLCWKAAERFFDRAGIDPQGLEIHVAKQIPSQAGMAGGSADAAAVLLALNRHYGCFSAEELRAIGLCVGSDVPFCIFGGTALAEGRGECLTRLPTLPAQMCYVLVQPDFAVPTPMLFAAIDRSGVQERPDTQKMLRAIARGDLNAIGALLANGFAPEVAAQHPVVDEICRALLSQGALGAKLTGTGSVIFGVFDSEQKARAAINGLAGVYPKVLFAKNV